MKLDTGTREHGRGRACVIVGAGGHARVVAALLSRADDVGTVQIVDEDSASIGETIGRWHVTGSFGDLPALASSGTTDAYLAFGDNEKRREMADRCRRAGFNLPVLRHPSAVIEPDAVIGEGSVLCAHVVIGAEASIGGGCIVNTAATVDHESIIEDFVHLAPGVHIAGRCRIGAGSFLGIGAQVVDRCHVGAGTVVGAGAVVVTDLPENIVAMGVPARVHRTR